MLGIPLVSGPDELVRAVGRFAGAFSKQVVFEADGPDLIDTLRSYVDGWNTSRVRTERRVYGSILDCLVQSRCLEQIEGDWLDHIKELPLIPTSDGVVSASEPNLFVPFGEEPPKAAGEIKLVKTGPRDRWMALFEKLGIPTLNLLALIRQVLIPTYGDLARSERLEVLRYIRDNFSRAIGQEVSAGGPPTIKNLLANSELILANDGEWRAASELFDPENRNELVELLGDRAGFPNMEVYASGREAWMPFFLSLGLKQQIGARDLLERISSLTNHPPSRESKRGIQGIFKFIKKHWDTLSGQLVGQPGATEEFSATLKHRAWLPAVQDNTTFAGFRRPEDRWYRLDELYPRSLGHRVCSQAPLFDGQDPAVPIQTALGMLARPPLEVVTAHFDLLRQLYAESAAALDVGMLAVSLRDIYTYFGQQSRSHRGGPPADAVLKARYENVPCIWDHPKRRFVRPRDCFRERVPFFEPHKVFVGGDAQVAPGLDALGRRGSPNLHDFIDFLQILSAQKDGAACTNQECRQVLHALEAISEHFDQVAQSNLLVLTKSQDLLPLHLIFEDDAPHLRDRIEATDIKVIDPRVPIRIRYAAPSLAKAVEELLDETPAPSINREIGSMCARVESIIRSQEFSQGLRRIVVQKHLWDGSKFVPDVERFSVCPATSISTSLYLETTDNEFRRIGGGPVRFFVDNQNSTIWVATISSRTIAIELARAIDGLLKEFGGVDLAALEDILRVTRRDEIEEVLDERRVPGLKESGQPDFDWTDTKQDNAQESGFEDSGASEEAPDISLAEVARENGSTANGTTERSAKAPHHAVEEDSKKCDVVGSGADLESARAPEIEANAGARGDAGGRRPTSQAFSSGSAAGAGPRATHPASDDAPPIRPGHGSSAFAGTTAPTASGQGSREPASGARTGTQSRGRFATYVVPAGQMSQESHDPDRSQHAMEIGRLAVERVLAFERGQGREPRAMPHSNPGYDVVSRESSGATRYIEVKGIDGPWGEAGVAVSKPQFAFATEKGDDAWLYIVEHVRDDANVNIIPINNPAGKVTHFCFDNGWRAVSDEPSSRPMPSENTPKAGDRIVLLDGEVVDVSDVEKHGLITRLTVTLPNGGTRDVIWRPGMSIERGAL